MRKIVFIRKKYEDQYKHLEEAGKDLFDYIWTEEVNSYHDLEHLTNRLIWYRGPVEDKEWQRMITKLSSQNDILNMPQNCIKSAIKSNFYRELEGYDFMPKVWFKPEDAQYPCVEKPDNGHSGEGIRVVDSVEDADTDNGDVWMEKIDFDSEWRVWCLNNVIIGSYWRKHIKGIEDKSADDSVDFEYIEKELPDRVSAQSLINQVWQKFPVNLHAIDLFWTGDKWYICEMNAQPGYNPKIWEDTLKTLKMFYMHRY